jgi:asparagine synthase (glutamine-hydrolysing)
MVRDSGTLAVTDAPAPLGTEGTTLDFRGIAGWESMETSGGRLWFKGYLNNATPMSLAERLSETPADELAEIPRDLDGHFGFAWEAPGRVVAATDPIGSVPIFLRASTEGAMISGLARRLWRDGAPVDPDAALEIAMGGFTIGRRSLVSDIRPLGCAHYLVALDSASPEVRRYTRYLPIPADRDEDVEGDALADVLVRVMEKTLRGVAGRPIVVPLSAGLDSRLIVGLLKELDCRDVSCISYGRPGNFEAVAARRIAAHLGYPWHFIEHTSRTQAATFSSVECRRFVSGLADSLCAVPFQQDFHAVRTAKETGIAPEGAVFINGQSGDFITGNHIPAPLCDPRRRSGGGLPVKRREALQPLGLS